MWTTILFAADIIIIIIIIIILTIVSFPLEHTNNAERGILTHGPPRFSISSAQACTLERILQRHLMVSTQHGKQQLPVISLTAKLA